MLSLRYFGLISCLFSGLLMSFASSAEARVYVAEPLLVAQPSYAGMQFYVYRPPENTMSISTPLSFKTRRPTFTQSAGVPFIS